MLKKRGLRRANLGISVSHACNQRGAKKEALVYFLKHTRFILHAISWSRFRNEKKRNFAGYLKEIYLKPNKKKSKGTTTWVV